jgi:hypothetical protein
MKPRQFAIITILVLAVGVGHSQSKPSVTTKLDPREFTLKGLRLGMTPEDALPIMKRLAEENGQKEVNSNGQPCLSDDEAAIKTTGHTNHSDGRSGKCVSIMWFDSEGSKYGIDLYFAEDILKAPGTARLWLIAYTQPHVTTDADRVTFLNAVTERYGPPSVRKTDSLYYCSEHEPKKTCIVHIGESACSFLAHDNEDLHCGVQLRPNSDLPPAVPDELAKSGLYASVGRFLLTGDVLLWDADFARQSANEYRKNIEGLRTSARPTF